MLIPFGVFSAAGAGGGGGGGAGSYELISTTVLGSTTSSVTFSSIDQTYKHLQIRMATRSSRNDAGTLDYVFLRFNGVTTSSYRSHELYGEGSAVASADKGADTSIWLSNTTTATATANTFGGHIIDILDYASTNKNTTVRSLSGQVANSPYVALSSGLFVNTAAVTSVNLTTRIGGGWTVGSRFSLYGIKG